MTMPVEIARLRIAREICEAEQALDEALLRQASLMAALVETRRDTEVEPFVGQASLVCLSKSQQALVAAGNDLARVHANLLKVQEAVTGVERCPPNEPRGLAASHIEAA